MYSSLRLFVEGKATVNPSTSVSAGSSPAAPIHIPELEFGLYLDHIKVPHLRKFYALDCNKVQQIPVFLFSNLILHFLPQTDYFFLHLRKICVNARRSII